MIERILLIAIFTIASMLLYDFFFSENKLLKLDKSIINSFIIKLIIK